MAIVTKKEAAKIKTRVAWYNMLPSLFWSALCLIPVSVFCYSQMTLRVLYLFLVISLLTFLLPKSFFDRIQLSKSTAFYKKAGVRYVNKFTQNGDFVNALIRKKNPHYKIVSSENLSIKRLISQTYLFEKFHFSLFVFFTLVAVYAFTQQQFDWVLVLLILNVIFNVYPNLLQQYIRVKLTLFDKRNVYR